MKRLLYVLFLAHLLTSSACQDNKTQGVPLRGMDAAYALIDQKRYAEAAPILEEQYALRPQDATVKQVLSSVYLAIAGIDAEVYFGIARAYNTYQAPDIKALIASYREILTVLMGKPEDVSVIESYLISAQSIEIFLRTFSAIPLVPEDLEPFVKRALYVMDSLPSSSRGLHLYRAIVQLVHLKMLWKRESQVVTQAFCNNDPQMLETAILTLESRLLHIAEDLRVALPSATNDLSHLHTQIADLTKFLKDFLIDWKAVIGPLRNGVEIRVGQPQGSQRPMPPKGDETLLERRRRLLSKATASSQNARPDIIRIFPDLQWPNGEGPCAGR